MSEAVEGDSETIELTRRSFKSSSEQVADGQTIIRITDGFFGWERGEDALKDVNVEIPKVD